jgi:hypothetical protein
VLSSAPPTEASLQPPVGQRVARSAAVSGLMGPPPPTAVRRQDKAKAKKKGTAAVPGSSSSMLSPPPRGSRRVSPTRNKEKEKAKPQKRKRTDDDETYQARDDLTAEKLVQQVMCHPMPIEIVLMYQLSVGMGTSCTSRCVRHCPSLRQL